VAKPAAFWHATPKGSCWLHVGRKKPLTLGAEDNRQLAETAAGTEDAAVQDSQGPIADRTCEPLGQTDLGILRLRKLTDGRGPRLGERKGAYHRARAGACVTHKSRDLAAVMAERFGDSAGCVRGASPVLAGGGDRSWAIRA
jgi:hypothetical protein